MAFKLHGKQTTDFLERLFRARKAGGVEGRERATWPFGGRREPAANFVVIGSQLCIVFIRPYALHPSIPSAAPGPPTSHVRTEIGTPTLVAPMSHHPPAPSLAALPVDTSKTDPTPAYYKLQFGDDLTGFSYYVRTLTVVIGRNCVSHPTFPPLHPQLTVTKERPAPVPPPAITNPSVPTNPPLDPNEPSPPSLYSGSILRTPPVANFNSPSVVEEDHEVNLEDYGPLVELAEAVAVKEEDVADNISPVLELPDAPPPPPPPKSSANIEHVDVDLGPLKSVSRNHAKIEYRSDLGRFCLEILGRNGAWIDDRYYVKGAVVPLAQGCV